MLNRIPSIATAKRYFRDPLLSNSFFLMLSNVFGSILGFIFWLVVARLYPPAEVGLSSALLSAISLLALFSTLGFELGLVRFLSGEEDKKGIINSSFTIAGICSVLLSAVFMAGLPLWLPALLFVRDVPALLVSFILFTVSSSLTVVQMYVFIASRASQFALFQQIISGILKILLAVALVCLGALGIFSAWGLAAWITLLVVCLFILKVVPGYYPVPSIKKRVVGDMVRYSTGNYIGNIASSAPNYLIPLIIVSLLGAEATAYFRIAFGIAVVLFIVPVAISLALFAEGAYNPERLRYNFIRATKLIFPILVSVIIIIFFFGDKILLLFGADYSRGAFDLLRLLSVSAIPLTVNELYIVVKRVELSVRPIIYTNLAIAVVLLIASYISMSTIGLVGCGIGWIAGQGLVALVTGTKLARWLWGQREAVTQP